MILQPVSTSSGGLNLLREDIDLIGDKNGLNNVFTTPDKFINTSSIKIKVFWCTRRLKEGVDFVISESGGSGTGYDTITLLWSTILPKPDHVLIADYTVDLS